MNLRVSGHVGKISQEIRNCFVVPVREKVSQAKQRVLGYVPMARTEPD